MRRDRAIEVAFIEAAARGERAFIEHVAARLEAGQELYGDQWRGRGVAELVGELLEEAADVGAWSALTLQAVDLEPLADADRLRLGALLTVAVQHAAGAHAALCSARALLAARGEVVR